MLSLALFLVPLVVLELPKSDVDFFSAKHTGKGFVREYYFSLFINNRQSLRHTIQKLLILMQSLYLLVQNLLDFKPGFFSFDYIPYPQSEDQYSFYKMVHSGSISLVPELKANVTNIHG